MVDELTQDAEPVVSVLMSVYNSSRYLEEAVTGILGQSFSDFEFLIVDDGSTDGSLERIEEFAGADSRIVVLRNETNLGLTRSLNRGIKRARGRYLARQDADDISLPQRLERQVAFLDANPGAGVVGTAYRIIDKAGRRVGERTPSTDPGLIKRELLIKNHALNHSSVMARTELLVNLGGYDETLQYAQDHDLWWRLSGISELANLDEKLIEWRFSSGQISSGAREAQLECMLEISLRIVRSLVGKDKLPEASYKRFWMACNSDSLDGLRRDDIAMLEPLWDLLAADGRYPPATMESIEDTAYRLYSAGNYRAAGQLSMALERHFDRRPGHLRKFASILKGLIPGK